MLLSLLIELGSPNDINLAALLQLKKSPGLAHRIGGSDQVKFTKLILGDRKSLFQQLNNIAGSLILRRLSEG